MSVLSRIVASGTGRRSAMRLFFIPIATAILSVALIAAASAQPRPGVKKAPNKGHPTPAAAPALNADGTNPDAVVKGGVESRVATAWDCNQPTVAPAVFAHAENGTVVIKYGTGPSCGRPSMKITGVFYTSNPGFRGTDRLYVMGLLLGGRIEKQLKILVK